MNLGVEEGSGRDVGRRDCQHRRAHHEHGTHVAYIRDRCRCAACRRAAARERKRYRLGRLEGRNGLVDASVPRDHVRALMAAGMSIQDIADRLGQSRNNVCRYLYGSQRRVLATAIRGLMAIPVPVAAPAGGSCYVPATGSRRRIHALEALGWPTRVIADRTGVSRDSLVRISTGRVSAVRAGTASAVEAAYRWMEVRPPTAEESPQASRVRAVAASRGWVPPLAWDDDVDLDDPAARPMPRSAWDPTTTGKAQRLYWARRRRQDELDASDGSVVDLDAVVGVTAA